jgi:hypothetical protein
VDCTITLYMFCLSCVPIIMNTWVRDECKIHVANREDIRKKKGQTAKGGTINRNQGKCIIGLGGAISWLYPLVVQNICWLALKYYEEYDQSKERVDKWSESNDARQLPSRWLVSHGYRRNIASHL